MLCRQCGVNPPTCAGVCIWVCVCGCVCPRDIDQREWRGCVRDDKAGERQ